MRRSSSSSRSRRATRVASDTEPSWKLSGRVKPMPERVRSVWAMRQLPRIGMLAVLLVFSLIPVFAHEASQTFLWTRVVIFAIAACSLTILSGWAGQLSLGQFAFSAIGGLVTVRMVNDGWFGIHNVPWLVAVAIGVLVGAAVALVVGLPALRIPGLYLAVTTLAFAVFVENWLVTRRWLGVDEFSGQLPALHKPDAGIVDFSSRRSYYYLCLAFLVLCLAVLAQIRRSGIGRSIIAVRDNERSAESMTVSSTRAKLVAFAVSGGIAALAGALYVTSLPANTPNADVRDDGVGDAGSDRRDRWTRIDRRAVARRRVGDRAADAVPRLRRRAAAGVVGRPAPVAAVLPRRLRRGRVLGSATPSSHGWRRGSHPRRLGRAPTTPPCRCRPCLPASTAISARRAWRGCRSRTSRCASVVASRWTR